MSTTRDELPHYLICVEVPDATGVSSDDSWRSLTRMPLGSKGESGGTVRITAPTLGDAQRLGGAEAAAERQSAVLVDLHVVLASDARTARGLVRDHCVIGAMSASRPSIDYVGTPTGLVGLITDMHTLGICDGVTLLVPPLDSILAAIAESVLPCLSETRVIDPARDAGTTMSDLRTKLKTAESLSA